MSETSCQNAVLPFFGCHGWNADSCPLAQMTAAGRPDLRISAHSRAAALPTACQPCYGIPGEHF